MEGYVLENNGLTESADNVRNYEEAIPVVKEYEAIIRFKTKENFNLAYRQGITFSKFKQSQQLV